jgi:hypothetical protein
VQSRDTITLHFSKFYHVDKRFKISNLDLIRDIYVVIKLEKVISPIK